MSALRGHACLRILQSSDRFDRVCDQKCLQKAVVAFRMTNGNYPLRFLLRESKLKEAIKRECCLCGMKSEQRRKGLTNR